VAFGEARLLMDVDLEQFSRRVRAEGGGSEEPVSATAQATQALERPADNAVQSSER
jgi:hypothetical protein